MSDATEIPWWDLSHPGYDERHRSGQRCWEDGCDDPAGTAWGPHFCPKHDMERKMKISEGLEKAMKGFEL